MILLISLLIVLIFSLLLVKSISKYGFNYILGAIILGILLLIFPIVNQRYIGLAFLTLAMYIGVLDEKKKYVIRLKSIRKELAIMAVILISFHSLKHLFNMNLKIYGIIAYGLLLPLFMTSFNFIRKKMNPKVWRILHKTSYIAYGAIYLHLIFEADFIDRIIYSVIFGLYYILRVVKVLR